MQLGNEHVGDEKTVGESAGGGLVGKSKSVGRMVGFEECVNVVVIAGVDCGVAEDEERGEVGGVAGDEKG